MGWNHSRYITFLDEIRLDEGYYNLEKSEIDKICRQNGAYLKGKRSFDEMSQRPATHVYFFKKGNRDKAKETLEDMWVESKWIM